MLCVLTVKATGYLEAHVDYLRRIKPNCMSKKFLQ